jgi:trans-aconitate methyltransferase
MFPTYPQHLFYNFIKNNLPHADFNTIIDCPCGEGYITNNVSKTFAADRILGVDIDEGCIRNANNIYKHEKLNFEAGDIHSFLDRTGDLDLFLLVNSIFLLPDTEGILNKIYTKLSDKGKLVVIIPNTESVNFKNFQKINPTQNKLIINKSEAITYFQKFGFHTEIVKGVAYVPYIGIGKLKYLWKFRGAYMYSFNWVNRIFSGKPCYWGFVLSKIQGA